ncbi:pirin family protein [Stackebrandtia nassauensis]|uniref:Pirin domain protein n=1 Tax=Stackebrandtia nassauensis (strain DSM 44728 / CIP 108903 / NRRL B-16338 / NBRC 102104 / LLR-40K-21) TaxID=446470 RepID=D3Q7F0_STANL|nr:pirin family protein [Stackebrandtia nassauensis]ADD42421.1 Pirin domain protein [Stackebrandtia nassauensis DSM 44728]
MSNPETAPREVRCENTDGGAEILEPREVPLGGPRAMTVRRTLPQRSRSLIGAWCFVDHYEPDDVADSGGMRVDGHPHTGLQTVSWLFEGEIEHRDTAGHHAMVRPGELNLMTAGSGIAHSEYSMPGTRRLHGAQLWVALPESDRFTAPGFTHYAPQPFERDGATVLVFLGSLLGETSPVSTFTPLLGAELTLPPGRLDLHVEPGHEHGVLVDSGDVTLAGLTAGPGQLVYRPPGHSRLELSTERGCRILLLGGTPLGERITMWWNFIGRGHDEIAAFREEWQAAREPGAAVGRFGPFPEQWEETLPAPGLPNVRLKPRG